VRLKGCDRRANVAPGQGSQLYLGWQNKFTAAQMDSGVDIRRVK
jgi:hypothetical protein